MSFAQGAPTQPLVLQGSNVFLYGSSTAGNAFTVQQLSAGNVASFVTSTGATSLIINSAGNVGIGTSLAVSNLTVVGNIYSSNSVQTTNLIANYDIISQGPYLAPSVSNASTISQWLYRVLTPAYGDSMKSSWGINQTPSPTVSFISTGGLASFSLGAGLMPDGRIISTFGVAANWGPGIFTPTTNKFSYVSGSAFSVFTGSNRLGGLPLPNGKVIVIVSTTSWGIFDPSDNSWATYTIPFTYNGPGSYGGGTIGADGRAYFVPGSNGLLGIYNYTTNTFSSFTVPSFSGSYTRFQLLLDGRLMMVPSPLSSNVAMFTPSTSTYSNVTTVPPGASNQYCGGTTLLPNGNVFMCAYISNGQTAGQFNPTNNQFSNVLALMGNQTSGNWQWPTAPLPNGAIYMWSQEGGGGSAIGIYNWVTNVFSKIGLANSQALGTPIVIPDGRIIWQPGVNNTTPNASGVGVIQTGFNLPIEYCAHPFFNHY